jgi:hypothetical protein
VGGEHGANKRHIEHQRVQDPGAQGPKEEVVEDLYGRGMMHGTMRGQG